MTIVPDPEGTVVNNNPKQALDALRTMYRAWHVRGPHATHDAPIIEQAIFALESACKKHASWCSKDGDLATESCPECNLDG